jgi:5-(carboxyamino)imidazole ribonucleotide mutase
MAAHLAGSIAANTTLPVIGVPIKASFDGLDALLATVQMPSGIPVATVAVDGSKNAAILAAEILSINDSELSEKLGSMRKDGKEDVLKKNNEIEKKYNKAGN